MGDCSDSDGDDDDDVEEEEDDDDDNDINNGADNNSDDDDDCDRGEGGDCEGSYFSNRRMIGKSLFPFIFFLIRSLKQLNLCRRIVSAHSYQRKSLHRSLKIPGDKGHTCMSLECFCSDLQSSLPQVLGIHWYLHEGSIKGRIKMCDTCKVLSYTRRT